MRVTLRRDSRRVIPAITGAVLICAGLAATARAADPESDARDIVRAMSEAVITTLKQGADKRARETTFRELYRRNFDNAGIAAWAAGRAYTAAAPEQQQEYLQIFETYVVKAYAALLVKYKGERLRVDKTETDRQDVIVISNLVHPDPRESREIEMKWRLHKVGDKLLVSDVVIDKISMALTEKRAFTDWLREGGGTLQGLTAKLRAKIAEVDKE